MAADRNAFVTSHVTYDLPTDIFALYNYDRWGLQDSSAPLASVKAVSTVAAPVVPTAGTDVLNQNLGG